MQLFPYQVEGAKFLATVKRGLLADEMGLGKSAQAITAAREVEAGMVVVVCPASLVQNWHREIERFWPELAKRRTYSVVSYDYAARHAEGTDWFGTFKNPTLILDEAHYLKNHKAKRTKAVFGDKCDGAGGLVSRAAHVFCLTGTPTPNNPSELWPMLRAVMPDSIKRDTGKPFAYWPFVEKFCVTQDTGFGIKIVRGKNLPELKERISPFILRRKKDDVLKDLPPIRFDTLALEGKISRFDEGVPQWEEVAKILAEEGVEGLRAIAPHVAQLRRYTGMAKVPATLEWIDNFLESSNSKLVIFCQHRAVIEALAEGLSGARSRKDIRQVDSDSRGAASKRGAGDAVPVRMRVRENGSVLLASPEQEHGLLKVPPEETRQISRPDVPAVQHRAVSSEARRNSLRTGLARDDAAERVPSSRDSVDLEQQKDAPKQPLPGSFGSEEGLHEGQRLDRELAGQRVEAQRHLGRTGNSGPKSSYQSSVVVLTGDNSPAERQQAVDAFQNDPAVRVFIGQIQAAGTGLTLTAASDALFVESSWTPSDNQQAAMRIHRIGQRNACLVRFAMLAGSIDENIQRAVLRKTSDIQKLWT